MQGFVCAIILGEFLREESLPTVASSMGRRQAYLAMHLGAEVGRTREKVCLILHIQYTIATPQSKRTPDKKPGVHKKFRQSARRGHTAQPSGRTAKRVQLRLWDRLFSLANAE